MSIKTLWKLLFIWVTISTVGGQQKFGSDYTLIKRLNELRKATINTVLTALMPNGTDVKKEVTFWCATRQRPEYVQVYADEPDLDEVLDLSKPVAFLVHGWFDNVNRTWLRTTVADYVKFVDTNVCAVDWSRLAQAEYSISAAYTPKVSERLVDFIESLQKYGVSLHRITIVGHSMGAHIAGYTGAALGGQIAEIVGLDPAGPGAFFKETGRLNTTNARFVQVLHTDQGFCGTSLVSGHQDYYPNNGMEPQPGCLVPFLQNGIGFTPTICSHYKAVEYFWASLNPDNKFKAVQCSSYEEFLDGKCEENPSDNFGVHAQRTAMGTLHLSVKGTYPYHL